jgi:GPH family glycoside/pentoside/hexuronide:cation symporter
VTGADPKRDVTHAANTQERLTIKEKLAYGVGDSAANLVFQTQITFLMFFYTDVFGIKAGTAGKILLISRIFDAFTDPVVGALADRSNSRWGRYRPWVLWTAVPMAVALVLCYTTPQLAMTGKVIWAIVTYNLLMIFYAANNIPYSALSGVITADSQERTSLASWRFVCAMAAALVVNTFTTNLVDRFGRGNASLGFPLTMALWGVLAILFFAATFAFTNERVAANQNHRSSVREDLSDLRKNGPWIALFSLAVLIHIQLAMRGGAMLYYFNHYLHLENVFTWIDNFGLFNGVGLIFTIVGVVLAKPLATRFGKRTTFRACLFLSSVLMAGFALVPPDSVYMLFSLQILFQVTFGPTIPILWSMMADVADYFEWTTGRRSTALAFASIIFGLKLGFGVGAWLNGELLEHFNYSTRTLLSAESRSGIVMMISIFPAAVLMIGVAVMFVYRLDDGLVTEIENGLKVRRAELNRLTVSP